MPEQPEERRKPALGELRLLVADDNRTSRELISNLIRAWGWQVDEVDSGVAALQRYRHSLDSEQSYNVVLADWHMPGMDGLQASRIIKRSDRLQNIPKIVMVTAFGREDIRTQAEEIGIDSYLLKPVNSSLLYDTLVDLFGTVPQSRIAHLYHRLDPGAPTDDFAHTAMYMRIPKEPGQVSSQFKSRPAPSTTTTSIGRSASPSCGRFRTSPSASPSASFSPSS